jgi:hypothetical protein
MKIPNVVLEIGENAKKRREREREEREKGLLLLTNSK